MAWLRCGSCLGNVYAEVGDIELDASNTTKVTLGWQPDEVWTMISTLPFTSTTLANIYGFNNTTLNDNNKTFYGYAQTGGGGTDLYSLPNTDENRLRSVDNDGFTMNRYTSNRKYCRYIAYKYK